MSLSSDGNRVAIGAEGNDNDPLTQGNDGHGHVRIYEYNLLVLSWLHYFDFWYKKLLLQRYFLLLFQIIHLMNN